MRHFLVLPVVATLVVVSVSAASAAVIQVPPGAGTLQAAIDAAAPGDTLVGGGVYTGPVIISKRLNIVADKKSELGGIRIELECAAAVGLTISADKVKTKGTIAVQGATTTAVVVDGTTRSKLGTISAFETCNTATTGFVIRNTTRTSFRGGDLRDFKDTAMRVEDLPAKAQVKLWGYAGLGVPTGFVITNVADGAGRKGAGLDVRVLATEGTGDGIVLTNADGVVVESSGFDFLTGTSVTIDAASANNIFRKSSFSTVSDAGVNTCWKGNIGHPDSCP